MPPAVSFDLDPRIFGANLNINFGFLSEYTDSWTQLHTRIGAAWEKEEYHRTSDGSLYFAESEADIARTQHNRFEANTGIGILQGIGWNTVANRPDIILYLYVNSSYDYHIQDENLDQLVFESGYPDSESSLTNSIRAGLYQDNIRKQNRVSQGFYREIAIEYGPRWLANTLFGDAEYLRLHGRYSIHQPLFTPGLYLVNTVFADVLWGTELNGSTVPLNQRARLGGFKGRRGLGGTVRGFGKGRFDADIKLANGLDIRYSFPEIQAIQTRISLIGYWDTGYYRGLRGMPIADESEESLDKPAAGWLTSNGIGAAVTILDQATIAVYLDYAWFGPVVHESTRIHPFSIGFGFHL
ncbi:hypothetical protein JCM12856_20540 [Spirochaeta dissipatitropha]